MNQQQSNNSGIFSNITSIFSQSSQEGVNLYQNYQTQNQIFSTNTQPQNIQTNSLFGNTVQQPIQNNTGLFGNSAQINTGLKNNFVQREMYQDSKFVYAQNNFNGQGPQVRCITNMKSFNNLSREELRAINYKEKKNGQLTFPQKQNISLSSQQFNPQPQQSIFGGYNQQSQSTKYGIFEQNLQQQQSQQRSLFGNITNNQVNHNNNSGIMPQTQTERQKIFEQQQIQQQKYAIEQLKQKKQRVLRELTLIKLEYVKQKNQLFNNKIPESFVSDFLQDYIIQIEKYTKHIQNLDKQLSEYKVSETSQGENSKNNKKNRIKFSKTFGKIFQFEEIVIELEDEEKQQKDEQDKQLERVNSNNSDDSNNSEDSNNSDDINNSADQNNSDDDNNCEDEDNSDDDNNSEDKNNSDDSNNQDDENNSEDENNLETSVYHNSENEYTYESDY